MRVHRDVIHAVYGCVYDCVPSIHRPHLENATVHVLTAGNRWWTLAVDGGWQLPSGAYSRLSPGDGHCVERVC